MQLQARALIPTSGCVWDGGRSLAYLRLTTNHDFKASPGGSDHLVAVQSREFFLKDSAVRTGECTDRSTHRIERLTRSTTEPL
jgi:hypothetical protein